MDLRIERRYNDRDIHLDSSLPGIAINYLTQYTGEFEPLIAARDLFYATGDLPVQMVRVVLNCMRHDAHAMHLLPPPASRVPGRPVRSKSRRPNPPPKIYYCVDCGKPEEECSAPRYSRDTVCTFKWLFMTPARRGGVIHQVRPKGLIRWKRKHCCSPLTPEHMYLHTLCGNTYRSDLIFFPDEMSAAATGRNYCRGGCWE